LDKNKQELARWSGRWFSTPESTTPEEKREADQIDIASNGYPEILNIGAVPTGTNAFRPWDNPEDASQRRTARSHEFVGNHFIVVVRLGHSHGEAQWGFDMSIHADAAPTIKRRRSVPKT